jgi:endo-1,4-beta-xylanase
MISIGRSLAAALVLTLGACAGGARTVTPTPSPTPVPDDGTNLKDAAGVSGRLLGAAVNHNPLGSEPVYGETLTRHFNYVTAEYEMKWDPIQSAGLGTYDWSGADAVVDFALAHGMKVKGHTLVWHGAVPAWANNVADEDFGPMIEDYIKTVVARFRGKVIAWDVVNEAFAEDGSGLRDTLFLRKMGPEYIARCFRIAHQADPDALLFYNDYGTEGLNAKSDLVYELAKKLKAQGVPINGVGLQMHISAAGYPPPGDIAANMERLAALGLLVNISEMDVRVRDLAGSPADKLLRQRQVYHDVVEACIKVPQCHAVTLWGFTDKYSWIDAFFGLDDPLIFDEQYRKKPAYYGLQDALLSH